MGNIVVSMNRVAGPCGRAGLRSRAAERMSAAAPTCDGNERPITELLPTACEIFRLVVEAYRARRSGRVDDARRQRQPVAASIRGVMQDLKSRAS